MSTGRTEPRIATRGNWHLAHGRIHRECDDTHIASVSVYTWNIYYTHSIEDIYNTRTIENIYSTHPIQNICNTHTIENIIYNTHSIENI